MKTNSDTTPALYIGLDVHKEKTSIAIADPGSKGEVRLHSEVATTQVALDRAIRRIAKSKNISVSQISICYEAGGCGMWIARMFMKMKAPCTVIAPSLIPTKSGDHVKTDKKDAIKLARLHRAGELVSVFVPDETDEAVRDLCRARVDAIDDRRRAKTRLLALLRRLGFNYSGKTTWTDATCARSRCPFPPTASSWRNSSARSTNSKHASPATKATWSIYMPIGGTNPSSMP
jgi:transposase